MRAGFKCGARKGRTMQDLFIVTNLERDDLQKVLDEFSRLTKKDMRKIRTQAQM